MLLALCSRLVSKAERRWSIPRLRKHARLSIDPMQGQDKKMATLHSSDHMARFHTWKTAVSSMRGEALAWAATASSCLRKDG